MTTSAAAARYTDATIALSPSVAASPSTSHNTLLATPTTSTNAAVDGGGGGGDGGLGSSSHVRTIINKGGRMTTTMDVWGVVGG